MGPKRIRAAVASTVVLTVLTGCAPTPRTSSQAARDSVACGGKKVLKASGSSAQAEAITLFTRTYERSCRGYTLDYTSSGSGAGRSDFIGGRTDFGGIDSPLVSEADDAQLAKARCGGNEAWNIPMVFGAIAIIFNIAGIDSLVLDPPTMAKIFNGVIKVWDAPEIAALNPAQTLPSEPIVVISRSDASGTTDNLQRYLSVAAGSAWGSGVGETFNGVSGRIATGNQGAWAALRAVPGSITYTAWPFARQNGLATADVITSAGAQPVALSVESVTASLSAARIVGRGNDVILDASAAYQPTQRGAYPIVMISYQTVCSRYPDPQAALAVKSFLTHAVDEGQLDLSEIGYVPIPGPVKGRVATAIAAIS